MATSHEVLKIYRFFNQVQLVDSIQQFVVIESQMNESRMVLANQNDVSHEMINCARDLF